MFENIGAKIKGLAFFVSGTGIVLSIIVGIAFMDNENFWIGLLIIVAGSLLSWIGCFCLYGFGQLVENSDIIAEQSNRDNIKYEKSVEKQQKLKKEKQLQNAKKKILSDDTDEDEYIDIFCPECGEKLSYFKSDFINNEIIVCPMCEEEFSTKQFK